MFETIDQIFAPEGVLAQGSMSYNVRQGQIQMAYLVAEALKDNRILVVEAGTGTGKTLAYLIPSIIWCASNDSKVVISTNTINLQDQIWNQEIPLLQELLPYEFTAIRIKGRSNYLCLRKWYSGQQLTLENERGGEFYNRLQGWIDKTSTGDKNELNLSSLEETVWHGYSADDYSCQGLRCDWAHSCFLRRVRREASHANIILVNHSLLLSDAGGGFGIIPEFSKLIVDEAHNLSATAINQFSYCLEKSELLDIFKLLSQVQHLRKSTEDAASEHSDATDKSKVFRDYRSNLFRILSLMFDEAELFFEDVSEGNKELRLRPNIHHNYLERLRDNCRELSQNLNGIADVLNQLDQESGEDFLGELAKQFNSAKDSIRKKLLALSEHDNRERVLWLEMFRTGIGIRTAPLDAANILTDLLYCHIDTVVLASATLRLQNSFNYFSEELGLSSFDNVIYEKVASAFDLSSQAKIFIADDLPHPNWDNDTAWVESSAKALTSVAKSCNGNVLALFTSHRHLLQTYELIKDNMDNEGIKVLAHDIHGDRYHLVQKIKKDRKILLLGTGSFWEGIDVPGDCLQCVVILKLPFPVPNSPILEAKIERLKEAGKNPFNNVFLPLCTIKLLQGIGRLIRSESDFGFAVILDSRLVDKPYAGFIIGSLPIDQTRAANINDICNEIEEMISYRKKSPCLPFNNKMIGD